MPLKAEIVVTQTEVFFVLQEIRTVPMTQTERAIMATHKTNCPSSPVFGFVKMLSTVNGASASPVEETIVMVCSPLDKDHR